MFKSLAIYTNSVFNKFDLILKIKEFFKDSVTDFVIFTDIPDKIPDCDLPVLLTYYMRFHDAKIVFLSIEDYLAYKDLVIGSPVLFTTSTDVYENNINKSLIKNIPIITLDENNNIYMVKS